MQIITLIKFHIDEHIVLNRAIDEYRRVYENLIDAAIDSQKVSSSHSSSHLHRF